MREGRIHDLIMPLAPVPDSTLVEIVDKIWTRCLSVVFSVLIRCALTQISDGMNRIQRMVLARSRFALVAGLAPGGDAAPASMISVALPLRHMIANDTLAKW